MRLSLWEQRSIRPDHRISFPDGRCPVRDRTRHQTCAHPTHVGSLANNRHSSESEENQANIPEVRMLINLPRGTKLNQTLNVWQECFRLLAEQQKTELAFRCWRCPWRVLKQPDWGLKLRIVARIECACGHRRAGNDGQGSGPINPYEQNRSAARDNVLLKALFAGNITITKFRIYPRLILVCSMSFTPSTRLQFGSCLFTDLPHESVYLLKRYLEMHPLLTEP